MLRNADYYGFYLFSGVVLLKANKFIIYSRFFCFFGVRDSAIYLRLSLVPLSKAIKLHNSLNRERTRLPYCFSISLADRLVVMWVWSFLDMYRSYRLNSISAMTLHSLP